MPKTKKPTSNQSIPGQARQSAADLVAKQLPGWRIDDEQVSNTDALYKDIRLNADTGATVADLERKFLGKTRNDTATDAGIAKVAKTKKTSTSVRVKPDDGGPSKVADIVGGKVKIVQG